MQVTFDPYNLHNYNNSPVPERNVVFRLDVIARMSEDARSEDGSPTKRPARRAQCSVPLSKRLAREPAQVIELKLCIFI